MFENLDKEVIEGFGDEWSRFDQSDLSKEEQQLLFDEYFHIFPWHHISKSSTGFDLGCGTGRWAKLVAPRVGKLFCIDPSSALDIAKKNLSQNQNCEFVNATVDRIPVPDASMDFGYSLGVLHHVPDTAKALQQCVRKLKPGAPFLIYLYYKFDNRPWWFKNIWVLSDLLRKIVSKMPHGLRYFSSQVIAISIYYPLARFSFLLEKVGVNVVNIPLSSYRNLSFYTMRTDALDRFGTQLEKRFTRSEIEKMMKNSGLVSIKFSNSKPFWCAVGFKKDQAESI